MSTVVHRTAIHLENHQFLDIKGFIRPLFVSTARSNGGGYIEFWYEVDEQSADTHIVSVWIEGTGNVFSHTTDQYIGTVMTHGGTLVWHVYVQDTGDKTDG